jgi:hypothetical protein
MEGAKECVKIWSDLTDHFEVNRELKQRDRLTYLLFNTPLVQARSAFHVVRAVWTEFGLHTGNMKFNTQNEECMSIRLIVCINSTVYFSTRLVW